MTDKEAIERCKQLIKVKHANWIGLSNQDAIETVLGLVEKYKYLYQKALNNTIKSDREKLKKDGKIKELEMTLARYTAQTLNQDIKQTHKHNEDLEMLYKGCQIELEEKDKIIEEMAMYIDLLDIDEDICQKVKDKNCDNENLGRCIDCIKEYFKKKVEEK